MAKLRSVNTHFWDDSYVVNLDPIEKLLFLYFLTNPLANIAGAYEISLRRVAFDTGIDQDVIAKILVRFEAADKMIFRDGWIFIVNFIKNQSLNPKIVKGIEESAKCCPDWIKHRLCIAYDSLSIGFDNLNTNSNINIKPNSNDSLSANSAEVFPNSEFNSKVENLLTAVKEIYGTNILPKEDRWLKTAEKAIVAEITNEEFCGELKKTLSDTTRRFPITPENIFSAVIENRAKSANAPPPPKRNPSVYVHNFPKGAPEIPRCSN